MMDVQFHWTNLWFAAQKKNWAFARSLSLFAALDTRSGEVLAQTVPRHTSAAFVEYLGDIVASQPKGREIHVILDNLATHKTQAVRTFLIAHPNVRLHFTPTYAS
jgi:hypothetical protein